VSCNRSADDDRERVHRVVVPSSACHVEELIWVPQLGGRGRHEPTDMLGPALRDRLDGAQVGRLPSSEHDHVVGDALEHGDQPRGRDVGLGAQFPSPGAVRRSPNTRTIWW